MSSTKSNQESMIPPTNEEIEGIKNLNNSEQGYDFDNPEFVFTPKGIHQWKQEGPYVICRSCEIEHAIWIGIDKVMVGIDEDGKPILKPR